MSKRKLWVDSITDAVKEIREFQSGKRKPLKTGFDHLDEVCMGGLYPGIITIGGKSGHGKTILLQRIENNLFELNPEVKIALLRLNFEMPVFNLVLRDLKMATGLKISDILLKPFATQDIKDRVNEIITKQKKYDISHIEIALDAKEFRKEVEAFILENLEKDNIIVSLDHIALTGDQESIDEVMKECIFLKQKYKKVTFIVLTQLNREINSRTNPIDMAPRSSDLYQSSTMEFASDVIVIVHNPFLMGYDKYLALNRERYEYLAEFFTPGKSKTASLETYNMMYYHYVKVRTPDDIGYRSIFAEEIGPRSKKEMTVIPKHDDINDF